MTETRIVVVGASGAGRRLVDIALDMMDSSAGAPFRSIMVVDDNPTDLNISRLESQGVPYGGTAVEWLGRSRPSYFAVGVGDVDARQRLANQFITNGHAPTTLIAPTAHVSRSAILGPGSAISPGVDISTNARVGSFVHVMANAAISHDVTIDDYCNMNPGAVVAGEVKIESHVTIGAGAVVIQGLTVGRGSTVGAGACVIRNVAPATIVKGVPAA